MAYVYELFYEDKEGDNICFYIGSGKNYRKDRHFMEWNLENGNNEDKKRVIREKEKLRSKILKEDLALNEARVLEESLLEREDVWEKVTNMKRNASGFGEGENNPNYGGLTEEHKRKIGRGNSGKTRTDEQKVKFSKNAKYNRDEDVVAEVKWLVENTDLFQKEISNQYGMSEAAISRIVNEESYWYIEPEKPKEIPDKTIKRNKERSEEHKKKLSISNSELSKEEIKEIRWLYENTGKSQNDISKDYPVCRKTVSNIVNRKSFSFVEGKAKPAHLFRAQAR